MATIQRPVGPVAASTPKPLLRRPTLVRKRDDDDEAPPSSPGKRAKVTFDSDVEVRVVDENVQNIIHEEVRQAFTRRARGDSSGYLKVKDVYAQKDGKEDLSPRDVKHYTTALLANVGALNKQSSDLVHAVLSSDWLGREEGYVTLYVRLLANLVSAQGIFLAETIRMLVDNLTASPPSNARVPTLPAVQRSTVYARAHKALQYLLQLIPSAGRMLSSILTSAFPHQADSRRAHIIYVQNLLKLVVYAPQLQGEVLALITDRLVKIDVQVQTDLELAEDMGEGLVQSLPQNSLDPTEDMEDSESDDSESDSENEFEIQRTKDIIRNVEKIDAMLDILFSYYDQMFAGPSIEDQTGALEILLSQWVTIILPTHSRHIQFLLFHYAQLSTTYIDMFVGTCVQITFDRGQPAIVRQAAAAYLASFVARGSHVPSGIVRDVFDYLSSELSKLRREHEPNCRGPDLRRYSSFYVLVQALLYIFCFRWRDLEVYSDEDFEDDDLASSYGQEHQWRSGVKEALASNLFSSLNPLKVCTPAITTEFARIANHLGLIYVYHLLEVNKRVCLLQFSSSTYGPNRETALSASKDKSHQHLDAYFPFDPYQLPRSKKWIEGDYREWAGVPGLDDGQAAESESEDDEAAESEVEEATETDETASSL